VSKETFLDAVHFELLCVVKYTATLHRIITICWIWIHVKWISCV